jgi:hypothetical protein
MDAAHALTAVYVVDFNDVPPSNGFRPWIEALVQAGITGGCGTNPPTYCPGQNVTRGQMAVFLLRGMHGGAYQPPAATGMFADVPVIHAFARWIEELAGEGITVGCAASPPQYCPGSSVTRGQMAVARWIEELAREGITGGCSTSPAQYCPDAPVTRGQMAVFLARTFNLPM